MRLTTAEQALLWARLNELRRIHNSLSSIAAVSPELAAILGTDLHQLNTVIADLSAVIERDLGRVPVNG